MEGFGLRIPQGGILGVMTMSAYCVWSIALRLFILYDRLYNKLSKEFLPAAHHNLLLIDY
jgi:hypothetical protein